MELPAEITDLTYKVIGVCMDVHREIGPGFPEEYYQKALQVEFADRKIPFLSQRPLPMVYKDTQIGLNFLDFEIEDKLILEIKSVNQLTDVHLFQVLKYLSVSGLQVALLVNFGKGKLEHKRILPTKKWQEFKEDSQRMTG